MNRFRLALLSVVLAPAFVAAADVTDPARLFPAGTLAYAEVHKPADFGPDLLAFVKGSLLEDSLKYVHDRRDATKDARDLTNKDEFGLIGLLAAPEMSGEFRKLGGAAVAVTGFNDRHDPEGAFAVLTGESTAVGLAVRGWLTVNPHVRRVGTASGVPVFQVRYPNINTGPNGQPLPVDAAVTEGPSEPTFAYTPGLFVVGTGRPAVAAVVARFKGEGKDALADAPAFQAAAAKDRHPGLFWYAAPKDLCAKLDAARKAGGETVDADAYALFKLAADPRTVRAASGSVRFRDKGLSAAAAFALEPAAKSPLLDLLSSPGATSDGLRHVPAGATGAVSVTLRKPRRAEALLGLLDAVAKAQGILGRRPSEAAAEARDKFKVEGADALLARTAAVTLVAPGRQDLPAGAVALPLLVLHAEDAATAAAWAEVARAVAADLSGAAALPDPTTETVGGQKVFSLPPAGLPWKAPLHYAVNGPVFVAGLDRTLVAAAATGRAVTGGPVDLADAVAVGTFSLGGWVRGLATEPKEAKVGELKPATKPVAQPFRGRGRRFPQNPAAEPDGEQVKLEAKALADWFDSLDGLPAAHGVVRRTPAELRVEWVQPGAHGPAASKAIDKLLGWLDRVNARPGNPNGGTEREGLFNGIITKE